MSLAFWKNLGKNKVKDAGRALQGAIVSWDPEGATEAEIATMEEQFDSVNKQFAEAKQAWQKEQGEADEIQATYNQRVAAAERLAAQVEAGGKGSKAAEEGLELLLTELEDMQEDVAIEAEEAEDAKLLMDDLQETVQMYADKLKTARRDLKKAANQMERAEAQAQRAEARADRAAVEAGLKDASNGLGTALEAMNRKAADAKADADAANHKAKLLGKSDATENDAVAAALAAVSGEDAPATSAVDRLAALRK